MAEANTKNITTLAKSVLQHMTKKKIAVHLDVMSYLQCRCGAMHNFAEPPSQEPSWIGCKGQG